MEEDIKKKNKLQIIIPVIVAIILVAGFVYLDSRKNNDIPVEGIKYELLEPISKDENPLRAIEIQPDKMWGCASPETIKPETIKEPDKEWIISRTGAETRVSLGKYRITNLSKTLLEIPKIWLYFFSNELGREGDNMYALEKSFVKGISLIVNGQERKLDLGGNEYMFIELDNYPFGDIYPYDKNTAFEFEFIIDLKCENRENGNCLDNDNKLLEYINNVDIHPRIRIFAIGCQEFTHDISIDSKFDYGE